MINNKTFLLQKKLGMYCRSGEDAPSSSINDHIVEYRKLVYNNISETINNTFPKTHKLIGDKKWEKTIDYFIKNHKCCSFQIWQVPKEFCEFFKKTPFDFKKSYPFVNELLMYEWLKIEIFMMPDVEIPKFSTSILSSYDIIIPNPEIKILPLEYPIHTKKNDLIKKEDKGSFFVSIHRDYYSKQIKINDLSYPFVKALLMVHEQKTSINDLKDFYLKILNEKKREATQIIEKFIDFAFKCNLFLGVEPNNTKIMNNRKITRA